MIELQIRDGTADDEPAVLDLFDEAVQWLVARGLAGQWGEQAFSSRAAMQTLVQRTMREHEVRIAEHEDAVVGVLAVGASPPYVPGNPVPELYVALLMSARRLHGNAIGARLLDLATEIAREQGARMMRVDCWAEATRLVRFYERHGFVRDGLFNLRGWRGQILSKRL